MLRLHLNERRTTKGSWVRPRNIFYGIIKEWGILHKLGTVTLDNASNCNTMMRKFANLLRGDGIEFTVEGNRIRCFPHIVNLCVKAGLRELTRVGAEELPDVTEGSDTFVEALQTDLAFNTGNSASEDVVNLARRLANALRASGQRLDDLSSIIQEGWEKGWWTPEEVPDHVPLRDMDVRWSSTFLMVDRLLEIYPAVEKLLNTDKYKDLRHYLLSSDELDRLDQIRRFLYIPHTIQEAVSADQTPTLPITLPAYENLLQMLKAFKAQEPEIAHGVQASIEKLQEYLVKTRRTKVYAIAMIINPTIKIKWLEEHWEESDVSAAKEWMIDSMAEYQHKVREEAREAVAVPQIVGTRTIARPRASKAARKQRNAMALVNSIKRTISNASISSNSSSTSETSPSTSQEAASVSTEADLAALLANDRRVAKECFERYCAEGILEDPEALEDFDLIRWWELKRHDHKLVYRVALDVMPAQASAVPSERVFSSAKETDTLRRNGTSPLMMEVLQVSKFAFKSERLNFSNNWVAQEEELAEITAVDIDPKVLLHLLENRELQKLSDLISSAYSHH
ncbi:hypothetical protein MD484_g7075, partial [Candolleomyces efflorescens]